MLQGTDLTSIPERGRRSQLTVHSKPSLIPQDWVPTASGVVALGSLGCSSTTSLAMSLLCLVGLTRQDGSSGDFPTIEMGMTVGTPDPDQSHLQNRPHPPLNRTQEVRETTCLPREQ